MKTTRADQGMTLLELTAVLAIFSLLAVLSLQMLSAALINRDRLTEASKAAIDVAAVTAVMRRDIETAVPVLGPNGPRRAFVVDGDGGSLAFAIAAESDGLAPALIGWRFDRVTGAVLRSMRAYHDRDTAAEVVMLSGATAWRIRIMTQAGIWVEGATWRGDNPWALPRAVDVNLTTDGLGDVRILVAR